MSLTVQSLFNSTLETYRLKLLAGKNGMNRTVSWMYYTEDASTIDFIRGGELAITTGMNVDLYTLITALSERGAVGLIVNVGRYVQTIPEEILKYCEKISFPLFSMPWEIHMIDIMQDFGNKIVLDSQKEQSLEATIRNAIFYPKKFEESENSQIEKSVLDGTPFASSNNFSLIAIELPESALILEEENLRRHILFSFTPHLNLFPGTQNSLVWIFHEKYLICILPYEPQKTAEKILAATKSDRYLKKSRIGISGTCSSIKSLQNEWNHAMLALKLCREDENFSDYNGLGIYKLLGEIQDKNVLKGFYDEILGKLSKFSEEKRTDYLNTLQLYLNSSGKVQKTAEENFTHRNTVNYRIKKIEETLGISIQDGEQRYLLQTALYIRELLKSNER